MMNNSIVAQLSEIQGLSLAQLRERWRVLLGTEPPAYSREHLIRRLCYRVQELAHGGIPDATRSTLRAITEKDGGNGQVKPIVHRNAHVGAPVVGTRMIREWHGERYEVTVIDGGFELGGKTFRSLSAVAKAITGQHWNGPLFFGIRSRKKGS